MNHFPIPSSVSPPLLTAAPAPSLPLCLPGPASLLPTYLLDFPIILPGQKQLTVIPEPSSRLASSYVNKTLANLELE